MTDTSGHRTKGEHYIPRAAYLEHFTEESESRRVLWVYPFERGEINLDKIKGIPPKQVCKETNLYESPALPVNAIERMLERIEVAYHDLLTNKILEKKPLTEDEVGVIALFVTTLEARLPAIRDGWLDFLGSIESKVQALEDHFDNGKQGETHREITEAKNWIFVQEILTAAGMNILQHLDFLFLENSKFYDPSMGGFFITSDSPVTKYDFTLMNFPLGGIIPTSDTAEYVVPLTPSVALFANNRGLSGYDDIHPNFISELNNRILLYSKGRIFSPHKLTERMCKRMIQRTQQSFILEYMRRKEDRDSGQD